MSYGKESFVLAHMACYSSMIAQEAQVHSHIWFLTDIASSVVLRSHYVLGVNVGEPMLEPC